jgi:hypothetical protein
MVRKTVNQGGSGLVHSLRLASEFSGTRLGPKAHNRNFELGMK